MNPMEQAQLREVMSERPTPPEDDIQASLDWETDPEAWKEPDAAPPAMRSLLDLFEDLYDEKSILDRLKTPIKDADPEFFDLVKAYWAQLSRDKSPLLPLTADENEFKALTHRDGAVTIDRLDRILETVFDWMISQGKSPVADWTEWISIVSPQAEQYLQD